MKIKYVGVKQDGETAFSRETGITWFPGTCEDVPLAIAVKMLKHPDVFAEDVIEVTAPTERVTLQPLANAPAQPDAGSPELDTLTREELYALAKARNIKVHHASGAATIKAAILADDAPTAG